MTARCPVCLSAPAGPLAAHVRLCAYAAGRDLVASLLGAAASATGMPPLSAFIAAAAAPSPHSAFIAAAAAPSPLSAFIAAAAPLPPPREVAASSYEANLRLADRMGGEVVVRAADVDRAAPRCGAEGPDPSDPLDRCPVCLEALSEAAALRRARGCGHAFCADCIETWLTRSVRCPVCKRDLAEGEGGGFRVEHGDPDPWSRPPRLLLLEAVDLDELAAGLALWAGRGGP